MHTHTRNINRSLNGLLELWFGVNLACHLLFCSFICQLASLSVSYRGSYAYVLLCPLYQDEYMVRSNSLNERIKLWDKFSGIVDQHAVKLNFLKHVHRPHPPFRVKRRLPARKTVTVSVLVASCYLCIFI